jgi:NAD(P)-dependent dehydrogenase (short-subunit alcohol dehydrogenase family)
MTQGEKLLAGKVALVTGGASGIGRATAIALADAGARIAVMDRDAASAAAVVGEVERSGHEARAFAVDLADARVIDTLIDAVIAAFGGIDILINSAGITGGQHNVLDFTNELFDAVINVNLRAPFLLTRAVGRRMIDRGQGGRIVNLSSSGAFRALNAPAVYAASKAAINALTRTAAASLGPHGINVNSVAPGMTKTPMTAGVGDDEAYQRIVSSGALENLLHRPSEAEDVANVIVFLCLPESRQITGQVIHTSAGQVV